MAMKDNIKIEILEKKKLFKKLNGMQNIVDREIRDTVFKHTLLLEREAKLNVTKTGSEHPQVDTGRLRASVTHEIGLEKKELTGKVGTTVEYGPYLEFGTSRMPPYPWLFPALVMIQPEFFKDIKKFVNGGIRNWWKR